MGRSVSMRGVVMAIVATAALALPADAADSKRKPPYFGSISAARARMRTGPGRTFPANWLYLRRDLPVRVVAVFKEWRKVEDPAGTQGWMLAALVSDTRTAIVQADGPVEMRDRIGGPKIIFRVAPGVVGRVSQCGNGWCRFDVTGQAGYLESRHLWGVDVTETLP
jgi:SH3-like domain-containing protein